MQVFVVANPAAGQETFDVKTLNARFAEQGIDWEVRFTKSYGDGQTLAREAIEAGANVVAAFGGDGTVAEVASGLVGTNVPLGIIPGGTANVMAVELGIPATFDAALALLLAEQLETRPVDVGQVDDRHFLLRLSMGLEAQMVAGADRALKDRLGTLAYALSAMKALVGPPKIQYRFEVDGKTLEEEGVACIIANSGNLGVPGLKLAPDVSVNDGLLDIFVINDATLPALLAMAAHVLGQGHPSPDTVRHLQGASIVVSATPVSEVQCDGELIGGTPKIVRILPAALRVVAPAPETPTNG
jgi:YegS/Rv2252/BmrU family lipid kinase